MVLDEIDDWCVNSGSKESWSHEFTYYRAKMSVRCVAHHSVAYETGATLLTVAYLL